MGRLPAPPLSMNRRYVPKSVLPVTSWLLNNEAAVGVAQNAVSAPVWLCAANHCLGDVCVCSCSGQMMHLEAKAQHPLSGGLGPCRLSAAPEP